MSPLTFFWVLFLFLRDSNSAKSSECEPMSTKFSYDEQILEKVIEMGHKVKAMEKDMRKTEEYLLSVLEYRRTEMVKFSDKLQGDLQADVVKMKENLELLKDRLDTEKPARVAFSAFNPIDKGLQSKQVYVLQSVSINEGGGYDASSGLFTAPVGGLYLFTAHVCNKVDLVIHYAITLNGEWIAASQQFEENDVNPVYGSCSSVSALTMMVPGDKVGIICTAGYNSQEQIFDDSYRRNTFLGVLLHK